MEGRPDMMTRPCNGQGTRRKNCHTIGRGSSSEKPAFYSGSDTTAETAGCFPSLLSHYVLLNRKTVSTGLRSPFPALRDSASFLLLSFVTLLSCSSLFHVSPLSPWFLGTPPLTSIAAQAAVLPTPSAPPTVPSPLGPQKDFCATSRQRLLVLHDNPNVENKFSSLFRRLREGHGFKISFVSFPLSHDRNPRLLLQQRGEAVFDHVLLLADNHRPFSNELAEALTSFFDSAATEEEKTPVFPPSSPLESRGRFCPSATRARNVFLMIHPSAHASVHAFVAEFMGVERQGETPSVQKKRGSEVFVVDYFNALKGYPRKTDNSSEDADEGYEDDEADGTIFKTRNLIPDQPHVVEPLRE
ncbi:dolichyl-diphosphooligosaccharide--protein glycosyltransferase, partial [Cystoisospora suis]